jgi:phytoene synthase
LGTTASWERRLSTLAHEPLRHHHLFSSIDADRETLRQAYAYCAELTRQHSKTFHIASGLLPPAKRRSVRALYAFCRVTDDLVDRHDGSPMRDLEQWRERTLCRPPSGDDPVALAWADTIARYRIPPLYAHQLIDGVATDVRVKRYETFEQLAEYSYGVASTVGLMSMHIVGFEGPQAIPYAVKLGVALQMTNILRDVREDWEKGRLYLPQEDMAAFGLREADIAARRASPRWRALIDYEIERTHRLYEEAMPGIALLHRDGRFAIAAAAELYRGILDDIQRHGSDVFSRRAHLRRWEKLRRLPGIWWRVQQLSFGRRRRLSARGLGPR